MSDEANALLARAMALPSAERAEVAARLGESVEPPSRPDQATIDEAWLSELRRREADYAAGRVEAIDGDIFMEKVRNYRKVSER